MAFLRLTKGLAVMLMSANVPLWIHNGHWFVALLIALAALAMWRWLPEE